jgi:hypothetical protein
MADGCQHKRCQHDLVARWAACIDQCPHCLVREVAELRAERVRHASEAKHLREVVRDLGLMLELAGKG